MINPDFSLPPHHIIHRPYMLISLVASLILVMDLMAPWGVAGGVPYIAVVLLSLRHSNPQLPIWTAAGCSMLVLIGFFFSLPVEEWGNAIATRAWALLAIWTTALLGRFHGQPTGAIAEREKDYSSTERVFESSPDHIFIIGSDYRFRRVNRTFHTAHRLSPDQVIGTHVGDVFGAQVFAEHIKSNLDRCFRGEEISDEGWFRFQDGESRYMAVSYLPLATAGKPADEIVCMSRDLTARKKSEDALHASELRLRTILDSLPNFVGIGTVEGVVLDCNLAPLHMAGVKKEDVIGKPLIDTYWIKHSSKVQEQVLQIIQRVAQGETVRADVQARMGDNLLIMVDAWCIPIRDATGHVVQIVLSGVDVTARRLAELALQKSKHDFQNLVDSLEGIVWECDFPSYQFTFVSRQAERLLGYPIEQWLAEPDFFCNHLYEIDRQWVVDHCKEATLRKENHEIEYRILRANGDLVWLRDLVTVVVEHDQPVKLRGVMFDITHRKRAEEAFRKSEERFRTYFETGLVGMAISSVEKILLEVNDRFCDILGFSREALRQCTWAQLTHPDDLPADESQFSRLLTGNLESYSMEKRFIRQDQQIVYTNLYVNAVRNPEGNVEYITAMIQDITNQKESESATRAAERLALATMNALSAYICVLDECGTIIMVNEGWQQFVLMNGRNPDRVGVGINYFSSFFPVSPLKTHDSVLTVSRILEVLEGKREEFSYDYECHTSNKHQWFSCRVTRFAEDGPLRVVIAHQDITEQKQTEWRLREAEQFTTSILENLPNMVFVKDAQDLRFVRFNQAGEHLLGYSREQLIGKNDYDFFPDEEADFFTSKDRLVLAKGELLDIPEEFIHTKDKGVRVLHTQKVPLYDEAGNPRFLLGISEDITKHKLMEDALQASESTLKSFYDSAPMMMGIVELVDRDIRHLSDNKAAGEFFAQTSATRFTGLASERGVPSNIIAFWVDRYRESQRLGGPLRFEYAHPDQQGIRWLSATVSPIEISTFAHPRFAYIVEDISERKLLEDTIRTHAEELEVEVERRALRISELEQRRMQVEKLAALAQVAAGIAHEINNPLASIAQSMVILKRALPETHPKYKYTRKIQECIDRITHIIQQLYKLYSPDPSMKAPIDIRLIVQSSMEIMHPFAQQRGIALTCTLPDRAVSVSIARADLIQVLCNLIQNAMDASSRDSNVALTLTRQHGALTICVVDQGAGISPDISSHIFEPFFTTKQGTAKGGMGLGLAVSRSLVEAMGGTLSFSSTPGTGTSFMITFPEPSGIDHLESP
jgi:PAS domain S-box-containing protein